MALGRLRRAPYSPRHPGPQSGGSDVPPEGVHVQGEGREDGGDALASLRGPSELRQHRREQREGLAARHGTRALLRDDARLRRRRRKEKEKTILWRRRKEEPSRGLGQLRDHGDGHHAPSRRVAFGAARDAPEERAAREPGRARGQRRRQRGRRQPRSGRRRRRRLAIGIRLGGGGRVRNEARILLEERLVRGRLRRGGRS